MEGAEMTASAYGLNQPTSTNRHVTRTVTQAEAAIEALLDEQVMARLGITSREKADLLTLRDLVATFKGRV